MKPLPSFSLIRAHDPTSFHAGKTFRNFPPSFIMQKLYRKALHPRNGTQKTGEKYKFPAIRFFIFHDAFDNLQEIYADFVVSRSFGNQLREIAVSHGGMRRVPLQSRRLLRGWGGLESRLDTASLCESILSAEVRSTKPSRKR